MNCQTVQRTVSSNLCTSCGICKNMCPKGSITWKREKGMYYPHIDASTCVNCGMCVSVCPGIHVSYGDTEVKPLDALTGLYLELYNAWSKKPELRHVSASGGVVSTMIETLLNDGCYDVAFCVDSYQYEEQLVTKPIAKEDIQNGIEKNKTPKSRYLPISHENAVSYMKQNRDAKVILVGTSCAVRGMLKVINKLKLKREQYLLIGLFCDKVFNYNVYNYFQNTFGKERQLQEFHFKNKESGGWPGNMKFMFQDGTFMYQDKVEREKVKEYFMPERCLYCIDKLNTCADISLGDNYTGQDSSSLGSNSVIIRTEIGQKAWQHACGTIEYHPVNIEAIHKAQYVTGRLNNLYFAELKSQIIKRKKNIQVQLNYGVLMEERPVEYEQAWRRQLGKLRAGAEYHHNPRGLKRQIQLAIWRTNSKHPIVLVERIYYAIVRKLKSN